MNMEKWDKEPLPQWKNSDGKLREKNLGNEQTLEKNMQNYIPNQKEKIENNEPKKLGELSNSYGEITFGVNKENELISVTSQHYRKNDKQLTNKSKKFNGINSKPIRRLSRGKFNVNSLGEKDSALEFRQNKEKSEENILKRMTEMMEQNPQTVAKDMSSFLSTKEDKEKLEYLRQVRDKTVSKTTADKNIEKVQQIKNEKEIEQIKMKNKFAEFVKKARTVNISSDLNDYSQMKKKKRDNDDKDDENKDNEQ